MFKSVRWRSEKNKITALFKLQFNATQLSHLGGHALVLSLIPTDTGKPTAKLDKYQVRDGCCYWENPIFETVKFVQESKTGKIYDKIYNCTISTGSSKSSVLGEVYVNMAEYAETVKAVSVSLPLKGSNSDAVLHVLIQRIQENVKQREIEEHEGAKIEPEHKGLIKNISNGDIEDKIDTESTDRFSTTLMALRSHISTLGSDKEHSKKIVANIPNLNDNRSASIGSDITVSSADSTSGLYTPQELGMINNTENLQTYLVHLSRKADMSDLELQTLRKQIVKERKRGQQLKEECEKLKASNKDKYESNSLNRLSCDEDPWKLLDETRKELNRVKELNVTLQVEMKKLQVVSDEDDDEEQKVLEEIVKQHSDAKETYILEQRVMDLCSEIEMYRRDKDELEIQMEQLALDYEILKQENHDMFHELNNSDSEHKLNLEHASALATIAKLEDQIQSLEEEIDKQAEGFQSDIESLIHAKVEVEHRAIRAEEELRLTKLKNVNTAERIQDEFKRLYLQIQSMFKANETVNKHLQELLQQATEELESVKSDFEAQLDDLNNKLNLKSFQIKEMFKQLNCQIEQEDEICQSLSDNPLSQKEKALETSTRAFNEKEKDLNDKTEELERRFQDLNHCGTTFSGRRKVDGKVHGLDLSVDSYKRVDSMIETSANSVKENGTYMSNTTTNAGDEFRLCNLQKEMASLREKNISMENELKEMQDMYLEMSVKFAEVEGQRQMLIMTLHGMKKC